MPQASLFKVKIKESEIQKAILELLRYRGVFCWRQNVGSFKVDNRFVSMGYKGISDIIGVLNGRFLAIEVKRPDGVLSEAQVEFLRKVRRAGGIAMVAQSLEDVVRLLEDANAKSAEKFEKLLG